MTKLLEKVVTAVSKLSEKEQNAIAAMILKESADGDRWEKAFLASQRQLSILAKEALEEYRSG